MQVRIEDVSPVEKKLIVEVPWATVSDKLGVAYRDLAKGVQLKGFRKGKVPRSVLERMFGKRVRAEVASQLVRESFVNATSEHKLEAVSAPKVDEALAVQKGQAFSFEAIVEVKGDVQAENYTGMQLKKQPVEVTAEEVEQSLVRLQKEHTELMPIGDRNITSRMDVLTVAIKGAIGDQPFDRPKVSIDLGEEYSAPLPGLIDALVGIPTDAQDFSIELTIPDEYQDSQIAGKTAALSVSIVDARQKQIPELDDEFAKDTGKAENLAELRDAVRAQLETHKQEASDQELRTAALKELVQRNPIPVASSLIERAIEMQFQRFQMMLGGAEAGASSELGGLTEEIRESLRPNASERVRGQLLVDAIARSENIEVSSEEVDTYIAKQAEQRGINASRLRAEYERQDRLEDIRHQLREDKVLDLLVERAEVTVEDISLQPEKPNEEASEETNIQSNEAQNQEK